MATADMDSASGELAAAVSWATIQRWEGFRARRQVACKKISASRAAKRRHSELTQKEKTAHRNVPVDMLATEWLSEQRASVDTRAYLVDGLLPTLVLGVEKLLTEVSLRGLADSEDEQPDFNPVNYLAQYLMRNNPRYSNFPEGNPYYQSMREVSEELKRMVFSMEDNHLAKLKVGVQQRRVEREKREAARTQEYKRQASILKEVFSKWTLPGVERVPLEQVQHAVRLWLEAMKEHTLAGHMRESFLRLLQDDGDKLLKEQEFIGEIAEGVCDLPGDVFDVLVEHLSVCGEERKRNHVKGQRRELFNGVFADCDPDKTGSVDRLRILKLFASYYNSFSPTVRNKLHNPRLWPVSEVVEAEEEGEEEVSTLSERDYQEFLVGEGEVREGVGDTKEGEKDTKEGEGDTKEGEKDTKEGEGDTKEGEGDTKEGEKDTKEGEGDTKEGEKDTKEGEGDTKEGEGDTKEGEKDAKEGEGDTKEGEKDAKEGEGDTKEGEKDTKEGEGDAKEGEGDTKEGEKDTKEGEGDAKEGEGDTKEGEKDAKEGEGDTKEGEGDTKEGEKDTKEGEKDAKEGEGDIKEGDTKEGEGDTKEGEGDTKEGEKDAKEGEGDTKEGEGDTKEGEKDTKEGEKDAKEGEEDIKEGDTKEGEGDTKEGEKDTKEGEKDTREGEGDTRERGSKAVSISQARKLSGMSSHPDDPSGPGSSWDHCLLNRAQLVQLVELFIGKDPETSVVNSVASFLRENYSETMEERTERLEQAELAATVAMRRRRVNSLFELWDNDRSGYLELDELSLVISKWKGFSSQHTEEQVVEILSSRGAGQKRLTRLQLHSYIEQLMGKRDNGDFEDFMDYLLASVKLTLEELRRGEQRQKFLSRIVNAGKTSGLQFVKALEEAISVLQQDGVEFGGGRSGSSVIMGLLETSQSSSGPCLHFKAASADCQASVVGHRLDQSVKQVSFLAVDTVRPVHVPNIQKHGGVFFFCPDHNTEEYDGSLVVAPIVTPRGKVVGTFSVDTLTNNKEAETSIDTHEINFYQGVGVCLGELFHWISSLTKLLGVGRSALKWIHKRCPQVSKTEIYIVEPAILGNEDDGYALRQMLVTSLDDCTDSVGERLNRRDDQLSDYLFQCVDNSEPVSASAYGRHHLAYPLRDHTGCAVAVVDLCLPLSLCAQELREVTRVLKLLTLAYCTINHIPDHLHGEETPRVVSVDIDREEGVKVLFDQLMLADLQESINNRMFAELRSYVAPPPVILHIVQALMYILYREEEFEEWPQCKQHITISLVKALGSYDPLSQKSHPKLSTIKEIYEGISPGSVMQQGSQPATYIYSWVSACLSLLEYSCLLASHTEG